MNNWNSLIAVSLFQKLTACLLAFMLFLAPMSQIAYAESTPLASPETTNSEITTKIETTTDDATATRAVDETTPITDTTTPLVNPKEITDAEPLGGEEDTTSPFIDKNYHTSKKITPEIDETTGALSFSYPIHTPPGRNGMEPNLSLSYNSQNTDNGSIFGYGWSLNIPYIERLNKTGTDKLYTSDNFYSSISGELVSNGTNSYTARYDDGSSLKYSLSNNIWTVTDKNGNTYKFGMTSASRQDDSSDSTKVFKWMLEETRDTNNNFIRYEYFKDSGQIYPSKIFYTGNGTIDGVFEVEFGRESRNDNDVSYKSGFKVKTDFRINQIITKINGSWVKKYDLNYKVGDNGSRSMLEYIMESVQGISGNVYTMPATDFLYKGSNPGWTVYGNSWFSPVANLINGINIVDVNGDSIPDLIKSTILDPKSLPDTKTYFGNGINTWITSSNFVSPELFFDVRKSPPSLPNIGSTIIDVNGDQLPDIVIGNPGDFYTPSSNKAYLNNGSTDWLPTSFSDWRTPYLIGDIYNPNIGVSFAELNGDGLIDIIQCVSQGATNVYLNTGSNWIKSSTFGCPTQADFRMGSYLADVNGDGLSDIVKSTTSGKQTFLNNGSGGWETANNFVPTLYFSMEGQFPADHGFRIFDVNGDNLPDLVRGGSNNYASQTFLNNGSDWVLNTLWSGNQTLPNGWCAPFTYQDQDTGVRITDVNADGMPDGIQITGISTAGQTGDTKVCLNNSTPADLLSSITLPEGGITSITYKSSAQYKDTNGNLLNPNLPIIIQTVEKIETDDGLGNKSTTSYEYSGGSYYFDSANPSDKKLAGFSKVKKTDSAGNYSLAYYHQGNTSDTANGEYLDNRGKIGRVYKSEQYDASGNIYSRSISKLESFPKTNGGEFITSTQSTSLSYDGNTTHKDKAEKYAYDTVGNLIQKKEYGEVSAQNGGSFTDIGTDTRITNITYAKNGTAISGYPSTETITNGAGTKLRETRHYYDTLLLGLVTTGNETKSENWKGGTLYTSVQKTYDQFGLPKTMTDARGKITIYSYDSYNLYPSTVTNPLNQIISYIYDYASGKPTSTTDVNGFVYTVAYDGLGRPLTEKIPDTVSPYSPVLKTSYIYTDTQGAVSVKKTSYLDTVNSVDSYQYLDGLGRSIQERNEAEISGNFNVRDLVYNNLGLLEKESLPYTGSGNARTTATNDNTLYTNYTYDPLQRVISITNTLGTTSSLYDDSKVTTTDANGIQKAYYKDAYGNLTRVDEKNLGATYTTLYTYNLVGNLTKITDALGNIRNFTYDSLGRRLSAQDLHASTDTTFGTWTYAYDDNGNITKATSPKALITTYVYDDASRMSSEDSNISSTIDIPYTYDSCVNGKGKLCIASVAYGAITRYTYDTRGNIDSETITVNGKHFPTKYAYDRQSNLISTKTPDNAEVKYFYNTAGLLEEITRKETTTSAPVITNFNYSPTNQIVTIVYANGTTATNTYDSTKLYRLTNKKTTNTTGTNLQDISYTYDPVGNITKIVDASATNAGKTAVYGYDDLYRLTSATVTGTANSKDYSETYAYDALGNITSKTGQGTYLYTGNTGINYANPHAVTKAGTATLTYDKNGNLLTDGTMTNTWNYRDQLASTKIGTTITGNAYDHNGNRARMVVGTANMYYPNRYYNANDGNVKKTKNIYAGDMLVATIETNSGVVSPYYVATDHLGGTNIITDTTGKQIELLDYLPYGVVRLDEKASTFETKRGYIGEYFDKSTGLNYLNARYYNSATGRFLSQDPVSRDFSVSSNEGQMLLLDPQLQNMYSYARNNPLIYVDRDGRSIETGILGLSEGIGTSFMVSSFIVLLPVSAPVMFGLAVVGIVATGYGAYSNYQSYTSGEISKDDFDRNAGRMIGALGIPLKLGGVAKVAKEVAVVTREAGVGVKSGTIFASKQISRPAIEGFKVHGVNQAITRGFKIADIFKIVNEGAPVEAVGRHGPQVRYRLQDNTVVLDQKNKVISVFSADSGSAKGLGEGNFIPFK